MRRRMIWTLLAFALAAPAVWAGSVAAGCCPIASQCPVGCGDCPFGR